MLRSRWPPWRAGSAGAPGPWTPSAETRNPHRIAPRTILSALASAGALGGLLLLGAILAAPSLSDGRLATEGLSYVLTSSLGDGVGKMFLADVAVAICVATLAIQTAGTRMLFSMARDRMLPFSAWLAKVSPRTGMPYVPAFVVGVMAAALVLLNLASPEAFVAIGTTCVAMLYLAYAGGHRADVGPAVEGPVACDGRWRP